MSNPEYSLLRRSCNQHGNVDLRRGLPDGLAHVCVDRAGVTLDAAGIENVKALTGFHGYEGSGFSPNFSGVVICAADIDAATVAFAKRFAKRDKASVESRLVPAAIELLVRNGRLLRYMADPAPEVCLAAVQQNGLALEFVRDQTPELCLEAVRQDGRALKFVREQTPELCLQAVRRDGRALEYVRDQTPDLCLAAVQQNGWALEFVRDQTPELCLEAICQDGLALQFVREQTPTLCLAAVRSNHAALTFVREQTPAICLAAIRKSGLALRFVREQTPSVCLAAVRRTKLAIELISDPRIAQLLYADPHVVLAAVEDLGCDVPPGRPDVLALKAERDMDKQIAQSEKAKQREQPGTDTRSQRARERNLGL